MGPYRSNIVVSEKRQEFGLMRIPVAPPHTCNTPGFWTHLWSWIIGRNISIGSLYRCECGEVWRCYGFDCWSTTSSLVWLKKGGYLPPLLQQKAEEEEWDDDEEDEEEDDDDDEEKDEWDEDD